MGNSESMQWSTTFMTIKNKHDEAFRTIERAIVLEEQEKPHEAIEQYKRGIQLIDEALSIPVQCPNNPDATWQKACDMIKKIKKTRAEVLTRINSIQSSPAFEEASQFDQPPSYEEAMSSTSSVADKVGEGTVRLGQFLAPHIQKQGTKLLTGFNMSEQEASEKVKSVLTVAAGAVEGFSTIYRGLETSAVILGSSLKDNTVRVVEHKWGANYAETTQGSLNTVGNVYSTIQNTKILRPKGMLKNTAKNTGKSLVASHSVTEIGRKAVLDNMEAGPSRKYSDGSDKENEVNEKFTNTD